MALTKTSYNQYLGLDTTNAYHVIVSFEVNRARKQVVVSVYTFQTRQQWLDYQAGLTVEPFIGRQYAFGGQVFTNTMAALIGGVDIRTVLYPALAALEDFSGASNSQD
jgi:hypothetical protein